MIELRYNITGLEEFVITFEDYCIPCPWQKNCRFGKSGAFEVHLECKDLKMAADKKKQEAMDKLANQHPDWDWDQRDKKAKVSSTQIYAEVWAEKVKTRREETYCMDSRRMDSMVTAQRAEEWWSAFREIMASIAKECSQIS